MAKAKRAADLIRLRNKPPSARSILANAPNLPRRQVGAGYGHQIGDALRAAIAAGDIPPRQVGPRYQTDKKALDAEKRRQAASAGFIEALRRQLTGDRLASPTQAQDDLDRLAELTRLADAQARKRRAGITAKLTSQIARLRKAVADTGLVRGIANELVGAGVTGVKSAQNLLRSITDRLTGDTLRQKLAGFDLLPRDAIPTSPISEPGFRRTTPTQRQQMTAVSSSNVASIGWEPHNQPATSHRFGNAGDAIHPVYERMAVPIPRCTALAI